MSIIEYIKGYRLLRDSEFRSVREILSKIDSMQRQIDQPVHLMQIEKGAVIKSASVGVWSPLSCPIEITIETEPPHET